MHCRVDEIAPDTFRLSTFHADYGLSLNQFLVRDEQPFLMHTGFRKLFPITLEGVSRILDPASLRWIGFSHFEPDECGALNDWLRVAPAAQALCSTVGARVMLDDFADRPARALADDEIVSLGSHRLRFLSTPHLPHGWDAGLFLDESVGTLFCSDLFLQAGELAAVTESDVVGPAAEAMRAGRESPLAKDLPWTPDTAGILGRLAALEPRTLAIMHGSSYRGDGRAAIQALTEVIAEVHGGSPPRRG